MDRIAGLLAEVEAELRAAMSLFGPMRSPHDGWAILHEEERELWDEIRANNSVLARREALQVAAMAVRFIHDISDSPVPKK